MHNAIKTRTLPAAKRTLPLGRRLMNAAPAVIGGGMLAMTVACFLVMETDRANAIPGLGLCMLASLLLIAVLGSLSARPAGK